MVEYVIIPNSLLLSPPPSSAEKSAGSVVRGKLASHRVALPPNLLTMFLRFVENLHNIAVRCNPPFAAVGVFYMRKAAAHLGAAEFIQVFFVCFFFF